MLSGAEDKQSAASSANGEQQTWRSTQRAANKAQQASPTSAASEAAARLRARLAPAESAPHRAGKVGEVTQYLTLERTASGHQLERRARVI